MHEQRERSPSAMISTSTVQLLHDYTGRGPTKAKTEISEDLVTILLADTLTTGRAHAGRERPSRPRPTAPPRLPATMRDDLVAIVERQLDRKVIAFMSQNHIDPDLAVEIFVLEQQGAG